MTSSRMVSTVAAALLMVGLTAEARADRNRYTGLQPGQSYYGFGYPYGYGYRRVRRYEEPPAYFDYGLVRPYPFRYRFAPEYGYDDGLMGPPAYVGPGFY